MFRRGLRTALLLSFVAATTLAASVATAAQPLKFRTPYRLGHGYALPWLGLTAGGYFSVRLFKLRDTPVTLSVRDLSLFLHRRFGARWRFFSETEIGEALTLTHDKLTTRDAEFDIERLYLDYGVATRLTLRFGKFLTPVGRWNLIHADPLVWTVTRPLTTAAAFARHATGLMAYGSWAVNGSDLDYMLFADDTSDLDPKQSRERAYIDIDPPAGPRNAFQHAFGMRLVYRALHDRLHLGFSAVRFKMSDRAETKDLVGADLYSLVGRVELNGESVYRSSQGGTERDEWGAYLQVVAPLYGNLYAIGYHERFKPDLTTTAATIQGLGLTYRPRPPISFKLERRDGRYNREIAPDGWFASIAVLL